MKIRVIIAMVTLFLVTLPVAPFSVVSTTGYSQPSTTVFLDPPMIKGDVIGENVTVTIDVFNVTDLYCWQAGVTFNANVLECTGFHQGEFLMRGGTTWFGSHVLDINNSEEIAYFHGCCLLGAVLGVSGSGQLGYLTFKVVGIGVSDLHLTDVMLSTLHQRTFRSKLWTFSRSLGEKLTIPLRQQAT